MLTIGKIGKEKKKPTCLTAARIVVIPQIKLLRVLGGSKGQQYVVATKKSKKDF